MNDEPENIYEPPRSPLRVEPSLVEVDSTELRDRLIGEQSYLRVFVMAFLGSVVGVLLMATLLIAPGIFFLAFALPGVVTGFAMRQFGKAIDMRYRLFGALITLLTYWLLIIGLHPSSTTVGFILAFMNAVVAGYISRRALSPDEEAAIYLRRMRME